MNRLSQAGLKWYTLVVLCDRPMHLIPTFACRGTDKKPLHEAVAPEAPNPTEPMPGETRRVRGHVWGARLNGSAHRFVAIAQTISITCCPAQAITLLVTLVF